MEPSSPNTPSRRYQDVAQLFRRYASSRRMSLAARPADVEALDRAERELGALFPMSYRWFQLEFGDFEDGPIDIYTVRHPVGQYSTYIVDQNFEERTESRPRLPARLIAFSDNGGGDLLCFDTVRVENGECPVVWWDHEQDERQQLVEAAPSFLDWIEQSLQELAAEESGGFRDALSHIHDQWMTEWTQRFRRHPSGDAE